MITVYESLEKLKENKWIITLWKAYQVVKILGLFTALIYTGAFAWIFWKLINGYVVTIYPDAMNLGELCLTVFGAFAVIIEIVEHIRENRKGNLKRL